MIKMKEKERKGKGDDKEERTVVWSPCVPLLDLHQAQNGMETEPNGDGTEMERRPKRNGERNRTENETERRQKWNEMWKKQKKR